MKKFLLVVFGGLLLIGGCLGIYTVFVEPDRLVVREYVLRTAKWPAGAPPLTIAVIADLHAGSPHINAEKIDEVVARANALAPDVILLAGDYVIQGVLGGRFMPPAEIAVGLAALDARLGTYAVLGNHDWWLDGPAISQALQSNSITVLENEAVAINHAGQEVWLAGIADDTTRAPDVQAALDTTNGDAPVIMFMHDPAVFEAVPDAAVLTIAGHTHGGQIYLPWLFAPVTPGRSPARWAYGHTTETGRDLFVSGGIGTSILPIRLNMPPEIMVIRVEHAQ